MGKRKSIIILFNAPFYIGLITMLCIYIVIPAIASNNTSANTTLSQNQSISNITYELATGNITAPPEAINRTNETPIFTPTPTEPPYKPSPSPNISIIVALIIFTGTALYINKKK